MTTRYNPNDGTGRWYEDEPEAVVVVTKIPEKKNDFVILALVLALVVIGLMVI